PAGVPCKTATLAANTTIKAIGCAAGYAASPQRQVVFADPAKYPVLAPPENVTLTATAGATVCYTLGPGNAVDPTCNTTTGACILGDTYSDAAKPQAASRHDDPRDRLQ